MALKQERKTRQKPKSQKNKPEQSTLSLPDKFSESNYDPGEYEKKMAEISDKFDEVLSSDPEEFVINFIQTEGE